MKAENLSWAAGPAITADGIDVPAMPGRILGLLGPNGSGKSTLLGTLTRTIQPHTGVVRLDDCPYDDQAPRDVARVLSVVQQKTTTDQDVAVHDVIDPERIPRRRCWAGPSPRDREVAEAAARHTGIKHLLDRDQHALSRGEQQHVHLARTFTQRGQVMLLDEPTNRLDTSHQLDALKTSGETGLGVAVALNDLNSAITFCGEVLVPHKGWTVCLGRPVDVLTEDPVREVYGVRVRILHPDGNEVPLFRFLGPMTQVRMAGIPVAQHSIPKTAVEGGEPMLSAAQPG